MMILHSTIQSFQHQHIYIVFAQGCHLMNPNVQMWCWWLSNVLLQRLKKENSFLFLHMSNLAYGSLFVHRGPKIYVSLCYKIFWQITYYKWHFSLSKSEIHNYDFLHPSNGSSLCHFLCITTSMLELLLVGTL